MKQTITIPDGWQDINIKTFQELANAKGDMIEKLSILIDKDPEEIRKWDLPSLTKVSNMMAWTNQLPTLETWKKEIVIDGVSYTFRDKLSSLSGGEWLDIELYLQDSVNNLHKIMALFYKGDAELFKEKMNVLDCYGAMLFFSTIGKESLKHIEDYLLIETLKMELTQAKQKKKEDKENQKKEKQLNGHGLGSFMGWLKGVRLN